MQLKKRANMPSIKLCPLLHIVETDQGDTTQLSKNAIFTISLNTLRWSALLKNHFLSISTESSANAPQESMPTSNISFVGLESQPRLISLIKFMAFIGTFGSASGAKYSTLAMAISLQESYPLLFASDLQQ